MLRRPASPEGLLSLLSLALLLFDGSHAQRLASSGGTGSGSVGTRFPEDLFSQPAVRLDWKAEPLRNSTALDMIAKDELAWKQYEEARRRGRETSSEEGAQVGGSEVGSRRPEGMPAEDARPPYINYLIRTAPALIYLCRMPSNFSPDSSSERAKTTEDQRLAALQNGLRLLEPLKETCLFHTREWFTYSFCHGAEVRQFRALPGTSAPGRTPAPDPNFDSFVLGRWAPRAERIWVRGADGVMTPTADSSGSQKTKEPIHPGADRLPSGVEESEVGVELVELVRFSGMEDQRYLSQTWGGGTPCDMTNEPRTIEIQFHCSPKRSGDRISMIKETVTCNYVMIIETSRLCQEHTFTIGQEEPVHDIACHPIVADTWKKGQEIPGHSAATKEAEVEEERHLGLEDAPSSESTLSESVPGGSASDGGAASSTDAKDVPESTVFEERYEQSPDVLTSPGADAAASPGAPVDEGAAASPQPSSADDSDFHSYGTEGGNSIFDDNASLSEGKVAVVFVDEKGDYFVELMSPEEARTMEGGRILPPNTEIREVIDERGEPAFDVMIDPVELDAIMREPQDWLGDVVNEAFADELKQDGLLKQERDSKGKPASPKASEQDRQPPSQKKGQQEGQDDARAKLQSLVDLMLENDPVEAPRGGVAGADGQAAAAVRQEGAQAQPVAGAADGAGAGNRGDAGGADVQAALLEDFNAQLRETLLKAFREVNKKAEIELEPRQAKSTTTGGGEKKVEAESLADRAAKWYALKEKEKGGGDKRKHEEL